MREELRAGRREAIEAAAYRLLAEKGYAGMSMLAVARASSASNETIYRWYGSKEGLARALVDSNTTVVRQVLDRALEAAPDGAPGKGGEPLKALYAICPVLLEMQIGDRMTALNRAAAADPSGELGRALDRSEREEIIVRLVLLMQAAIAAGSVKEENAARATEWLMRLLVGDWQVRRVTGVMPMPGAEEIAARVAEAWRAFRRLAVLR